MHRDTDGVGQAVHQQLLEDYPPEALDWVPSAHWQGPIRIPLDRINFKHKKTWRAYHEPEKVEQFARKIEDGWKKPVIFVKTPNNPLMDVLDGHHRALAYEELGEPVYGYVAHVGSDHGPWDELHAKQYTGDSYNDTGSSAPNAKKPEPGKLPPRIAPRPDHMNKPKLSVLMAVGKPGPGEEPEHGEYEEGDFDDLSMEEIKEHKKATAKELIAAIKAGDVGKVIAAYDTLHGLDHACWDKEEEEGETPEEEAAEGPEGEEAEEEEESTGTY